MTQFLPLLITLACPIGMATMMALPALGRLLGRRPPTTDAGR